MALATPETNPVLAAAMASIEQVASRAEATVAKQEKITKKAESVSASLETAVVEQSEAGQVISLHEEIAALKAQNQSVAIIEASGTVAALAEFQRDLVETSKEVVAAQDEVEAIQNQPVEGVMDYLSQLFELMGPEDKLQAARVRQANLTGIVSTVAASTESVQRAVATTKRSKNVATIEAGQELLAAKGNEALGRVQLESLARNSDQLAASMRADAQSLSFKLQANTLHNTAVNQAARERDQKFQEEAQEHQLTAYREGAAKRKIDLESSQLALESAKLLSPTHRAAAIARNERVVREIERDIAAEKVYVADVQKAQAILNVPVEDAETIITQGMNGKDKSRRIPYDTMRKMGAGDNPKFGVTVGDAIINTSKTTLSPTSKPAQLLALVGKEFASGRTTRREKMPKNEKELQAAVPEMNAIGAALTKNWSTEIKQGDSSNPYHAPPMAVLAEEYAAVSDSKLYKNVLADMEMKEFDAKELYKATVAGIAAKTVSIEEAALGLEAIFDSAVEHNNNTWMFDRAGLPVQDSYKSEIVEPPMFSGGAKGAGVGAGIVAAGLATSATGVGAVVGLPLIAAGGLAGTQMEGMFEQAYPLTDSTDRTQVMQTLTKLISDSMPTRSFFK